MLYPALNAATAGRDLAVRDYLALAQRQGYEWVEFDRAQIVALGEMSREAGLELLERTDTRIASFFLPVDWSGEEERYRAGLKRFAAMLPRLKALGATRCCTWLMPNYPTPPWETRRWATARLGTIAAMLHSHGLSFGLEFVGPAHLRREPGFTFLYRLEEMIDFAESLGPNVGVLIDSLHWYCTEGSVADIAAIPKGRLIHAHIDDAPGGARDAVRDDGRLLPGEGAIDLKGFLMGLSAAGYDGPVGIEVDGPALQHLTPDDAAAAALRAWRSVADPVRSGATA